MLTEAMLRGGRAVCTPAVQYQIHTGSIYIGITRFSESWGPRGVALFFNKKKLIQYSKKYHLPF